VNPYVGRHARLFGLGARYYDADTTRAVYSGRHRKP